MFYDRGFDINPRLQPTKENEERYARFIAEVLKKYGRDSSPGGRVADVVPQSRCSYIEFQVGDRPRIPYKCQHFLRFSSKVKGSQSEAETCIRGVYKIAKRIFGDCVRWRDQIAD